MTRGARRRPGPAGVDVGAEPLADAVRYHPDPCRRHSEQLNELAARELRHGDHQPGAAGQQRQDPTLVGDVGRRVGLRVAQRGRVVDHHHVAPRDQRGEVGGRVDQRRSRGPKREHRLLPGVTGPVGQRRLWPDHPVAVRAQRRQAQRHLPRQALDAADLGADRSARVDHDGGRAGPPLGTAHYWLRRAVRRMTSPDDSRPSPRPPASRASKPV